MLRSIRVKPVECLSPGYASTYIDEQVDAVLFAVALLDTLDATKPLLVELDDLCM